MWSLVFPVNVFMPSLENIIRAVKFSYPKPTLKWTKITSIRTATQFGAYCEFVLKSNSRAYASDSC